MNIKNNKGITLSTVMISVILLIVIMSSIILSASKTNETKKAMLLNNDIEELNRKVNLYYLQNGIVPIDENIIIEMPEGENIYYNRLMIEVFDNLNLNNKELIEKDAYGSIKTKDDEGNEIQNKCYVINEETHLIYYVEYKEVEKAEGLKEWIWEPIEYKYSELYKEFLEKVDIEYNKEIAETKIPIEPPPEYFTWEIKNDEAIVTGLTELGKEQTELTIPTIYKGKQVTTIGENAFLENTKIENITMESVITINNNAFNGCSKLLNIEAQNLIKTNEKSFSNCISLKEVKFPNLKILGALNFEGCSELISVEIPLATTIGRGAFNSLKKLEKVIMPEVTDISYIAFQNCERLTNIEIPKVTSILNLAFYRCSGLKDIIMPKITKIGERTFDGCENLTKIEIPIVKSIGHQAFTNCYGLTKIEIPLSCTSMRKKCI